MTGNSLHQDRRQKLLDDLAYVLSKLRLFPGPARLARQPVAKRKASRPARWMIGPIPPDTGWVDQTVPSRGGALTVRVYRPVTAERERPPVLYLHGGGWITGGLDSCHWLCAELASRLATTVTSVDYRLAPEHPFPAALEDCQDALDHLSADEVIVGGDSAGGNLAAALAYWDADHGRRIVQQLLIYPALDLTMASHSWWEGLSRSLRPATMAQGVALYLGPHDPTDPLVSPLLADSVENLPPAVILTGEHDPLRDDGSRYADRLAAAGVPVAYRSYATLGHGFFSMPRVCRESTRALDDLIGLALDQLGGSPPADTSGGPTGGGSARGAGR